MDGKGASREGGEVLPNQASAEVVIKVLSLKKEKSKKIGQDLDHGVLSITRVACQQEKAISGSETGHLEEDVRKVGKPNERVRHPQTLATIGLRSKTARHKDLMSAFVI